MSDGGRHSHSRTGARVDGLREAVEDRRGSGEDNGCTGRWRGGSVACAAGWMRKRRRQKRAGREVMGLRQLGQAKVRRGEVK